MPFEELKIGSLKNVPTNVKASQIISGEVRPRYLISSSLTDDYDDVTSPSTWQLHGSQHYDYCFVRDQIKYQVSQSGFYSFKEHDQKAIEDYCATDANTIIGWNMTTGSMSQPDAVDKYYSKRATDVRAASACYYSRIQRIEFTIAVIKYLGETEGMVFQDAINNFLPYVENAAILGKNYGDSMDSIMDYIEGTNAYASGGLQNYNIQPPYQLSDVVNEFKEIIVYGKYQG